MTVTSQQAEFATVATVMAPRPHWAVTSCVASLDSHAPHVAHEGVKHSLTAPDGTTVAEAQVEVIIEVGDAFEPVLMVQGGGFGTVPIEGIPAFAASVRSWADNLFAEHRKVTTPPAAAATAHQHPVPPPAWAVESSSGMSGRYGWTRHDSEPVRLIAPGGYVVAEAELFLFAEDTEPVRTLLRVRPEDDGVTDDGEGVELDADQADAFIAAAEAWLDRLRSMRAQMGGGQ